MADESGPAAVLESDGITRPPEPAEDIPEDDWAEANEDGATGTEEEEADAESYDTEDEDPVGDEVCPCSNAAWRHLKPFVAITACDHCNSRRAVIQSQDKASQSRMTHHPPGLGRG